MKKKVTFEFYNDIPKGVPVELGLKLVLWEITIPGEEKPTVKHDWGFALWQGVAKGWEEMEVPEGWSATVAWWADTLHPDVLLVEPSKIIKLN